MRQVPGDRCQETGANSIQFQFNSILIQFSSIQFNSVQLSSVHFSSVQFSSIQFSFNSVQFKANFNSVQFSSIQFNSGLTLTPTIKKTIGNEKARFYVEICM